MIEMPSEWPWALGCVLGAIWVLQNICLGSRAGVIFQLRHHLCVLYLFDALYRKYIPQTDLSVGGLTVLYKGPCPL